MMSAVPLAGSRRFSCPLVLAALAGGLLACGIGTSTSTPEAAAPVETDPPSISSTATAAKDETPGLTFDAEDATGDCFNGFGEPDGCAGLDLVRVQVGLEEPLLARPNDPRLPVAFVIGLADPLDATDEFGLYLYLDLDQDTGAGLDMSSGPVALPGIDRLIGVTLPQGDAWTQAVGNGGYDAEIVRDDRVSATVEGRTVVLLSGRGLLDENAPLTATGRRGWALRLPALAGGAPNDFTLYLGAARSIQALDYFNVPPQIQVPLGLTVPTQVLYPPGSGGGS